MKVVGGVQIQKRPVALQVRRQFLGRTAKLSASRDPTSADGPHGDQIRAWRCAQRGRRAYQRPQVQFHLGIPGAVMGLPPRRSRALGMNGKLSDGSRQREFQYSSSAHSCAVGCTPGAGDAAKRRGCAETVAVVVPCIKREEGARMMKTVIQLDQFGKTPDGIPGSQRSISRIDLVDARQVDCYMVEEYQFPPFAHSWCGYLTLNDPPCRSGLFHQNDSRIRIP